MKLENKSISQLKKTAWKLCSEYNRRKDVNWRGYGSCCTCKKRLHWTKGDAGHFMAGRRNAILFDDRGIHLQCLTKESLLRLSNGRYKNINKISIGDELDGFDKNDFTKKKCDVVSVDSFIPAELYKIELEKGSCFYATKDHKIVVYNEWKSIGDLLHNPVVYDILEI